MNTNIALKPNAIANLVKLAYERDYARGLC
jgi:hypothetical protein